MIRHDTVTEQYCFIYHSEFNFIFNDFGNFNIAEIILFVVSANSYEINVSASFVIKAFKSNVLSASWFIIHSMFLLPDILQVNKYFVVPVSPPE